MALTRWLTFSHEVRDRRWGRMCSVTVAAAMLGSAFLAPAALAGKPDRLRVLPFDPFVDPPGFSCPAAIAPEGVLNSYVGGNQALTVYDTGKQMFTGSHSDRMTNVATGKSVVLDFHGSVAFIPRPDGSGELRLSGTNGFVFFPGDVGPGDVTTGRNYVFTGDVKMVSDANGSVTAFESNGQMEDACTLIR